MKKLKDGTEVPSRCWYYLLDFNDDDNLDTMYLLYKCNSLRDMTASQFYNFLKVAADADRRRYYPIKG